jgi:hypothetical protein
MVTSSHALASSGSIQTQTIEPPASSNAQEMQETEAMSMYQRFMALRDHVLEGMTTPPAVKEHVGIAVFAAWADGAVDEAFVEKRIANVHESVKDCPICLDNFEYYRVRRVSNSLRDK